MPDVSHMRIVKNAGPRARSGRLRAWLVVSPVTSEIGCQVTSSLLKSRRIYRVSKTGWELTVSGFFFVSGPVRDGKPGPVFYILCF